MKILGNLDTKEGKESLPFIQSMIPWTERIYDMTDEEIAEYKSAFKAQYHSGEEKKTREVVDIFYCEYQYFQVRKTWDWVLDQYALSGDKMAIRREILLQRLRGSTESPIDPEDLEYLISNMKKSTRDIILCNKWRYLLYDHGVGCDIMGNPRTFDPNIPYIVGVDPSAGGGGDNFAVCITNPYNLKIAAEFKSKYISGPAAVQMLIELITEYIPKAVLIPEKNNMGIYLIQMLYETPLRDNLYWSDSLNQVEEITTEDPNEQELRDMAMQYKKYGATVSSKTRGAMISLLFQYLAECKELLLTEYLVDDICKLVRTSTGRIEAVKGEHDDSLFAWLHTVYLYQTGDNLEIFGINRDKQPGIGPSKVDLSKMEELSKSQNDGFFSTSQIRTYEDYVIDDMIRQENEIQDLASRFSFINNPYDKKGRNQSTNDLLGINPYEDNSIPASFFDQLNGIDY